jgi:hypothetical protein
MRYVGAGVLVLAVVAGCGRGELGADPDAVVTVDAVAPADGSHEAAARAWAHFPADRTPRPVVFLDSMVAGGGFADGDAKSAAMAGQYELAAPLPQGPATASMPDGTEVPIITAAAAFEALRAGQPQQPGSALLLKKVDLGTARFHTDRGPLELPAWRFDGPRVLKPIAWPALAPELIWPRQPRPAGPAPEELPHSQATVSPDGLRLTVLLLRAYPPCAGAPTYRHEAVVTETPAAVVVGMRKVQVEPAGRPGEPCPMDAGWSGQEHMVRLAAPLGGRVVVNPDGAPLAVTTP